MNKVINNALIALTIIPLIGSCGKSDSGEEIQEEEEFREDSLDGSTIDGKYLAKFTTLNPQVNGTLPGSITLFRDGDRLLTYARLFAGKPRAWHPQAVHRGTRCPTMSDDRNGDGYIDIQEALKVVGDVMIPLDANMNSQSAGKNFYPIGDLSGYYHYERVASFDRLFDDLREKDKDETDHIGKLAQDEAFGFAGRVVMVQGVTQDVALPETVAGLGRYKAFQVLPITCGIIRKNFDEPGTPDNGEIPGPVDIVREGQDQPGATPDDTTGGTIPGNTTGSNDSDDGEVGDGGTAGGTPGSTTGSTTGGDTTGGTTGGGTTGRSSGGFIGGFIGGSSGGGTSGGTTGGGTTGRSSGGFIGGFIGGSSGGGTSGGTTGDTTSSGTSGR